MKDLSPALWYRALWVHRVIFRHFHCLERMEAMRTFGWDKGDSETSCVQVITSSLCQHACILEQFTYPGKPQRCILALNCEIDYFDLSSGDSKGQELIKQICDVGLTSIIFSFFFSFYHYLMRFLILTRKKNISLNMPQFKRHSMTVRLKNYFSSNFITKSWDQLTNNTVKITDYILLIIS